MNKKAEVKPVRQIWRFPKKIVIITGSLILLLSLVFFVLKRQSGIIAEPPSDALEQGRALTAKYCQSCHLLPDPSLLDKDNWKKLLPEMGVSLGIHSPKIKIPEEDRSFYPAKPVMNAEEWQSILDFYHAMAPAALPVQNKAASPQKGFRLFSPLLPPETLFRSDTKVTCVRMDKTVNPQRLFVYDAASRQLFLFDKYGLSDSAYTDDIIVDISFYGDKIYACSIGNSLTIGTSSNKSGKVFPITVSGTGKLQLKPALFEHLARPVQAVPTDLDGNGRTDFLICEFGGLRGALSWMENRGAGSYQQHILRNMPGSVKVHVKRNKETKRNDVWALFAQGEEGVFHFNNKGDGTFDVKQVLQFPPSYGSTSFEMADMNGDGLEDIVYTCGDNGDVTNVLKPYHGIYVYTNAGGDRFQKAFFYPMHGCYSVIAQDFRKTGKIDLAAVAYFTDPSRPEPFVYLKNTGNLQFTSYNPPKEITFENILTMDAGDFNGDGKQDLIIGNALTDPSQTVKSSPFAILANTATE